MAVEFKKLDDLNEVELDECRDGRLVLVRVEDDLLPMIAKFNHVQKAFSIVVPKGYFRTGQAISGDVKYIAKIY